MASQRYRRGAFVALAMVAAGLGLSGCFDAVQTVGIDRQGAGRYLISVAADGIVGQALKNEKLVNKQNHATLSTSDVNGRITRTATVDFKSLSELAFSDEIMSQHVTSRDLFGLGPSHVAFVANLMIDKAKNENPRTASANNISQEIAQSILGDHTYVFTVTVPGDVERAVPITIGNQTYQPTITGDFYNGRVVTWRLPLYALVGAQALNFEVDFWAYGFFNDTKSRLVAND
jgi:hypothetical protein